MGSIYSQMKSGTSASRSRNFDGGTSAASACVKILESEDIFCPSFAGASCMNADPESRESLLRLPNLTSKK